MKPLRDCCFLVHSADDKDWLLLRTPLLLRVWQTRDNTCMPDIVACFAVPVGVHPFALRSAAIVLLVLLCLLHGCAVVSLARLCGVPTRQNSVTNSFEASCERLLSGSTAVVFDFDLLRASWSAGTPRLRYVRIDRPVFMSGGAFELSLFSSSSARDLQHWDLAIALMLRCNWASKCSGDRLHLSSHLCILRDVLIAPFREWNLLCCVAVFWHCI